MHVIAVVAEWAYQNVVGNLVASAITFAAAWVWKIRPLHKKVNRLHAHLIEGVCGHGEDR